MKKTLFSIEDGHLAGEGNQTLSHVDLSVQAATLTGVFTGSLREKRCLLDWFTGQAVLEGKAFWGDSPVDPAYLARMLKRHAAVIRSGSPLIPTLTREENVFLFADKMPIVSRRNYIARYQSLLAYFQLSPDLSVFRENPVCTQMILQLLKGWAEHKKLLVIAETAGLLESDYALLTELMSRMAEEGISLMVLDAAADPLFDTASLLYIIRHGRTLSLYDQAFRGGRTNRSVIESYTWSRVGERQISAGEETVPAISFDKLSTAVLKDLCLSILPGAVLRLNCLDQKSMAGMQRLFNGKDFPMTGQLLVNGDPVNFRKNKNPAASRIGIIREAPQNSMLLNNMDIFDNLALPLAEKTGALWIDPSYRRYVLRFAQAYIEEDLTETALQNLSSASRLKIVYLRWILFAARAVICINPFNEVDVSLLRATMEMLREMNRRGIAVLILSESSASGEVLSCEQYYLKEGRII